MNNIIRLPEDHVINFATEVGLTGQDHDNYAEPGSYPRYDWMRMIVLGLLANQTSDKTPTEFRPGTLWYDLTSFFFKCSQDGIFGDLSKNIQVNIDLKSWSEHINYLMRLFIPTGTFSGIAYGHSTSINIPNKLQPFAIPPNKPYLFKLGKMISPDLMRFNTGCPVCIELTGDAILASGDHFTVFIQ